MLIACSSKKICAYYMYALISGYWYALINGIIMRTRAIYRIHGKHIKSVRRRRCVPDRECCRRSPYLQEVRSPTVCEGLQPFTREDRNDYRFAACLAACLRVCDRSDDLGMLEEGSGDNGYEAHHNR